MQNYTLDCVIQFMDVNGFTAKHFEETAMLPAGTIELHMENNTELSNEDIGKIIFRYGNDFVALGFIICPVPFGKGRSREWMILERDLNKMFLLRL